MKQFKLITSHKGFRKTCFIIVDDEDAHLVRGYEWKAQYSEVNTHPYVFRNVGGVNVYLHHQILNSTKRTYHKNGNSLDNRRCNLTHKPTNHGAKLRAFYRLFEKEPAWR